MSAGAVLLCRSPQTDNLLTGWVRQESRRQLSVATAALATARPGANSVTPM
jgi:hypothetical protein